MPRQPSRPRNHRFALHRGGGLAATAGLLLAGLLLGMAPPAAAQSCNYCPGAPIPVGMCSTSTLVQTGAGCSAINNCQLPVVTGPTIQIIPQGSGVFTAHLVMNVTAPWNFWATTNDPNGTLSMLWFDVSPAPAPFASGGDPSLCQYTASDVVNTWVEKTGLTCAGAPYNFGTYSLRSMTCGGPCPPPFPPNCSCGQWQDSNGLAFQVTPAMLGCPQPPKDRCGAGDGNCKYCLLSGRGAGGGKGAPDGGGGFGSGGQGAGAAPAGSGPGALLRYTAGGAGATGNPGSAAWTPTLGRNWSHDYAERIVEDPDQTHVWLITRYATFREFSNLSGGTYGTVSPTDEKRKLLKTAGGWQLVDLNGTVESFDGNGLWLSTVDRNGNAKTATYTGGVLTAVSFPDGRSETFAYAASGKLQTITEVGVAGAASRTWTYTWTGDDLTQISRPDGTAWVFEYQDTRWPGFMTQMILIGTDSTQRIDTAWAYDASGNVIKMWKGDVTSGANGVLPGPNAVGVWQISYDNPQEPATVTITDPLGLVSTRVLGRDTTSNKPKLLSISNDCPTCGLGPNTQLTYGDPVNPLLPTREINGRGFETDFSYDANGELVSITEAAGTALARTRTIAYGNASFPGFWTSMTEPSTAGGSAVKVTTHQLDAAGNLATETVQGSEGGSAFTYSTARTFNAAGQALTVDPPGYGTSDVTSYTWDASRGNLIPLSRTDPVIGASNFQHDAYNRLSEITDANGVATDRTFDALDRMTASIQRGATSAGDQATTYSFTPFGDLFRITLPAGNVVEMGYDGAGRVISVERKPNAATHGERRFFTLDAFGNRTKVEFQKWNGSAWADDGFVSFVYSTRCHLDKVVRADGATTEYAYDCNDNLADVWDPKHPRASNPASRQMAYDALDRMTSLSEPWAGAGGGNAVTAYGYDVQDNLTSVTDAEGNVTTYTVGDRKLRTGEVSPVSGTTVTAYNEHGIKVQETDADGTLLASTVDALDRVTQVTMPKGNVTYAYDDPAVPFSKGRMTAAARIPATTQYAYDRFGRVTQDGGLTFGYDKNGNRTTVGYPNSVTATYTYDFADRPLTVQLQDGANPVQTLVSAATYKSAGPLASLTFGNGLTETRGFNSRYLPTSLTLGSLLNWTYTTDVMGNVTAVTDNLSSGDNRSFAYQDVANFLITGNGPWGTRSWTYDQIGNRLTETRSGTTDTYSYIANGAAGHTPKIASVGSETYQYDADGQVTRIGSSNFGWDYMRLLLPQQASAPATGVTFQYDARNLLWKSSAPGSNLFTQSTSPTYGSDGTLYHRKTVTTTTQGLNQTVVTDNAYICYFGGRPVATLDDVTGGAKAGSTLLYLTTDHLGAPLMATGTTASVVWQGGFEPFGAVWNNPSKNGVFLRLHGMWDDPSWSSFFSAPRFYYNVNRWYDESRGGYVQPDPMDLDAGARARRAVLPPLALYMYGDENPLGNIDPFGLESEEKVPWWDHWPVPDFLRCLGYAPRCYPCMEKCFHDLNSGQDEEDLLVKLNGKGDMSGQMLVCALKNPSCKKAYEYCPDFWRDFVEHMHQVEGVHALYEGTRAE